MKFHHVKSGPVISSLISCSHCLHPPAYPRMLVKVSGRLSISGVKIMMDHTAIALSFAVLGLALEDMDTAVIDVFDGKGRLKKA